MFEINNECIVRTEFVEGSPLYIIDDFYQDPDEVLELFFIVDPIIWKPHEKPSYNQVFFDDRRHFFESEKIKNVYEFLSKVCKQKSLELEDVSNKTICTNFTRFKKVEFNDYENNYWWPHRDDGYNAVLYLNKEDAKSGTNLYECLNPDEEPPNFPEHYQPWRSKSNYRLVKTIEPKYNRMVLFDGLKFPHGMNICNEDYFGDTYRMNQVFFFKEV